ncbi:endonuclease domain-containing protein [Streptomyces sp. NPDC057557]|uniref:endonuclease domain-containing protein n=1 Tax=Streptomyces sp. NPDC057557 TaxID=3346167 RepID=UPI0036B8734A
MQSEDTLHPSSPLPGTSQAPSRHTEKRHGTPDTTCVHYLNYALTCDQYDDMRRRANGRCEICQTPEAETTRGMLVVDHFQGGGAWFVRGMLCDRCNSVMSRHDRAAVWGPASLPFREKAAEYHLNAFGRPTPADFRKAADYIAARKPFNVRDVPRPAPAPRAEAPKKARQVRLDRGVKHLARGLLRHLTPEQLTNLVELLKEGAVTPGRRAHSAATNHDTKEAA